MASTTSDTEAPAPTLADLLERLGDISPRRILLDPLPGTATEADLLRLLERKDRICELIDGTLVEKAMGTPESGLAGWVLRLLGYFVDPNKLGYLFPGDGAFRILERRVRFPDVCFVRAERLPQGYASLDPIANLVPDFAVEVLSEGNTSREMLQKRKDYFLAGVALVWQVDPRRRVVEVYSDPETVQIFTEADTLDGGTVLPGLQLPVSRVFEPLPVVPRPRRSRKKKPGT